MQQVAGLLRERKPFLGQSGGDKKRRGVAQASSCSQKGRLMMAMHFSGRSTDGRIDQLRKNATGKGEISLSQVMTCQKTWATHKSNYIVRIARDDDGSTTYMYVVRTVHGSVMSVTWFWGDVRTPSDDLFYESRVSPERAGERVGDEQKRGLGIFSSSSPPFRPCLWEIFPARRTKCGLTGEKSLPPSLLLGHTTFEGGSER